MLCGDITDVSLENNKVVLRTTENFLYEMITSEENLAEIKKALEWQGYSYDIEVIKIDKDEDLVKQDLDRLKKLEIKFKLN